MKISELIAVLERRKATHGDIEVKTTWEGTDHEVDATNVYLVQGVLWIDADENAYKPNDNHEGEDGS